MGLGIGVHCERCGEQISYDSMPFKLKEEGAEHDICGDCLKERRENQFDKENPDW